MQFDAMTTFSKFNVNLKYKFQLNTIDSFTYFVQIFSSSTKSQLFVDLFVQFASAIL